jgi:ribonuclease HI
MMLYITTTNQVVSAVIVVERKKDGHVYKVQWPVYNISEVLSDSKVRYPHVQKLLYTILITSRKLRHYLDGHKITVVTDFPLEDILHNCDATGRISKWAIELGSFNINFTLRKAIKSQVLTNFVAEWTELQQSTPDVILEYWKMYFDGSLKLGGAGAGVLFISPDEKQLKYVLQILWQATNNEAEYEALIHGLQVAVSLGIKRLIVYGDSAIVVNQVNKDWDCTKETMHAYCAEVRKLEKHFQGLEILHVLRDSSIAADILAKLGSDRAKVPPSVLWKNYQLPL